LGRDSLVVGYWWVGILLLVIGCWLFAAVGAKHLGK